MSHFSKCAISSVEEYYTYLDRENVASVRCGVGTYLLAVMDVPEQELVVI